MRSRKRGQSTAEYAIVISVVIAAIIGMQLYVKRGLQAKAKTAMDAFGTVNGVIGNAGPNLGVMNQYEPYYAESNYSINTDSSSTDTFAVGGKFGRNNVNESTRRTGFSNQGVNVNAAGSWK